MTFLYRCLTYLYVVPLSLAALFLRLFDNPWEIERLGLGLPKLIQQERPFWFVASSVGEVNVATRIIQRLKSAKSAPVILTVTTKTGRRHAQRAECGADIVAFQPFDLPTYTSRFLSKYNPIKVILIETELWPTLLAEAIARGIPILQVSGRLSERSQRRYRPFTPLFRPLLQKCDALLMQSAEDAARLRQIAGPDANISVFGSAKIEYVPPPPEALQSVCRALHAWQGMNVIVCGSTRPGEEEILLEGFQRLLRRRPQARLVLAPRHLDRVEEVSATIRRFNLSFCRRSQSQPAGEIQVLLLDTLGELNLFYHCGDIGFVGGTLLPFGGHNLLEPALAGKPVLYGPHYRNQLPVHDVVVKYDMGIEITDSGSFCGGVESILSDPESKSAFLIRAERLRRDNSQIVDRYVAAIIGQDTDGAT